MQINTRVSWKQGPDRQWSIAKEPDNSLGSRQSLGQETSQGHTRRSAETSCGQELAKVKQESEETFCGQESAKIKPGLSRDKWWSGIIFPGIIRERQWSGTNHGHTRYRQRQALVRN